MPKSQKTKLVWPMPEHLCEAIQDLQAAVDNLSKIAGHKQKKFTLDGRLIGDLGEVIAAHYFDLTLTETQEAGFDATIASGSFKGQHVEVKCRRKSTGIGFDRVPKHLIALKILPGDQEVEVIYAGGGDVLKAIRPTAPVSDEGKFTSLISVSTSQLGSHFSADSMANLEIPLRPESHAFPSLITAH